MERRMGSGRELKIMNLKLIITKGLSLRGVYQFFAVKELNRRINLVNMGNHLGIATSNLLRVRTKIETPRNDVKFLIREAL